MGVVLEFFVHRIIIKIKKILLTNQSNFMKGERRSPLTMTECIKDSSLEQLLNEAGCAPDIQRETDIEMRDDDWLNDGVPEASASTIKKEDDEWLNAGVEELPKNIYKQQLDDWLNAENNQSLETVDEFSLNHAATNRPEIQIKQDGSILNITVTASQKQGIKSEQTGINFKISLPSQVFARKGEGPYDIEITADDLSPSDLSLQDIITAKPAEEPFNQSHALMDEITVRPVESPVLAGSHLMDEIYIRPVENQVTVSHALMDEITVRPVESPVLAGSYLMDEITVRPVENQVTGSHVLMDEINIRPSSGPVIIEYELLDDLITKSAISRSIKEKPSSRAVITSQMESSVEKAELEETIAINEITEFLNKKRNFKQVKIPSVAIELRNIPLLARIDEGIGNLSIQAESLHKKVRLPGAMTKVLAALRVYNNNAFYIQDTNLTHVDTLMEKPQIEGFTFKVVNTAAELDELINGGYDLVMNCSKIKRGLKKGMVAFLIFVERELASMGWACMTKESKATFRGYPFNDDLDRQGCIVGDWTNPKFRDSGISSYVKHQRQQLLKEKGFIFERSIVEENIVEDHRSVRAQERFEITYKRRTYTNISLPGILGVEFWKEDPLNDTDTRPLYQMIALLILVLPSPPMVIDWDKKT